MKPSTAILFLLTWIVIIFSFVVFSAKYDRLMLKQDELANKLHVDYDFAVVKRIVK